jgi:manganese/zinc/iron transport system permease protein
VISATFPRLAAGAVIVLSGAFLFALSLGFGRKRGVVIRWWQQAKLRRETARVDLLRAVFEILEHRTQHANPAPDEMLAHELRLDEVAAMRHWQSARVRRLLSAAVREGLLTPTGEDGWRLTLEGAEEARRITRNHRLWEMYLMRYAHIAPNHVDRDADLIEHVLDPELVAELERQLKQTADKVPVSSHATQGV